MRYTQANVRVAVDGKAGIVVSRSGSQFLPYTTAGWTSSALSVTLSFQSRS
jgi:hypothetical protein